MKTKFTILSLILFIANLLLVNLPLLNAPSYDFALVNSLLSFLAGGTLVVVLRKNNERLELKSYSIFSLILFFIPFVVSFTSNLLTNNCPVKNGILFYIFMVFPSFILGSIASQTICNLFEKGRFIFFILTYLALLGLAASEFYFYPQVYLFNPVFGYFPGTIYDEGLSVSSNLIIYSILNLIAVLPFLFFSKYGSKKIRMGATVIYATAVFVIFLFVKPGLGLTTTFGNLEHELNNKIETEHFVIFAPENISKKMLREISLEHEFYFKNLSGRFDYRGGKIKSFLFKNDLQKGELFGAKNADFAKPWLNSVFVSLESYHQTLEHELAHVFAGNFSTNFLKIAGGFNFAMIEGFAVMAVDDFDGYNLYDAASMAVASGFAVSPVSLFEPFNFYKNNSSLSYLFAGAFLKYTGEKYGFDKVAKLYADLNFEKHTKKSLTELSKEFEQFISGRKSKIDTSRGKIYFGRKSIITKVCPREMAENYSEALNMFKKGEYKEAYRIFSDSFNKSKSFKHFNGMVEVLKKEKKYSDAYQLFEENKSLYDSSAYRYSFYARFSDLAFINGRFTKADSMLAIIEKENPGQSYRNFDFVRRFILKKSLALLSKYITGSNSDKYLILSDLLKNSHNSGLLSTLIVLAGELNIDYELFMKNNVEFLKIDEIKDSYLLYRLGLFAKENFDYRKSLKFLNFAKRNCKDKRLERKIARETALVAWFIDKL